MRPRVDAVHSQGLEGDADGQRPGHQGREGAVVVPAAVTEAVARVVEAHAGNQQAVGLHDASVRRDRDAERSGLHQAVRTPLVKLERVADDDRQRGHPARVAGKPLRHRAAQVGLAAHRPVKSDRAGIGLCEPTRDAALQSGFPGRTIREIVAHGEQMRALQLSGIGAIQSAPRLPGA